MIAPFLSCAVPPTARVTRLFVQLIAKLFISAALLLCVFWAVSSFIDVLQILSVGYLSLCQIDRESSGGKYMNIRS